MSTSWYFRDKADKVQGPFSNEEMRAWYEAGYLSADLPLAKGDPRKNEFKPLATFFPNGNSAFMEGAAEAGTGSQWYFLDRNRNQQGPFTDIHMRQWHMAGYFEPTLQIINTALPNPKWATLREYFPGIADAFAVAPSLGNEVSAPKAPGGGGTAPSRPAGQTDPRFTFPEWLPVPPRYRGIKKVYPSEKNGGRRRVAIRDVTGQQVQTLVTK